MPKGIHALGRKIVLSTAQNLIRALDTYARYLEILIHKLCRKISYTDIYKDLNAEVSSFYSISIQNQGSYYNTGEPQTNFLGNIKFYLEDKRKE